MLVGFAIAVAAGPPAIERLGRMRFRGIKLRHVLVASVALLAVLLVLVGPGRIAGDFAAKSGRQAAPTGGTGIRLSVSGSGRAQFWGSALDAFASAPVKGIGTGSFPTYWNQHGGLETPVQNAHSEPLELLAEVGPLGFLAFFTFFGVAAGTGIRRARGPDGAPAGACLGVLATGLVGLLIDWTWDVPSVMVPVLVAAALICARALDPARRGDGARRSVGQPVLRPAADSGSGARARSGRDRVRRPRRRRRPRPGRNDEPAAEQRRRARPRPARCGRRGRTIGGRDPALVVDPVAEARDDRARRRQRPRRPRRRRTGDRSGSPTISASGCSRLRSS